MNKQDIFYNIFFDELESLFSADIMCCQTCIDRFIIQWPGVYNRDQDFQRNVISLKSFYFSSRVSDYYSENEFNKYSRKLKCPNCGNYLNGYIWPYNMNFEVPEGFQNNLFEIAEIASETPFLLLKHPFAQQVYSEINNISNTILPVYLSKNLFRARVFEQEKNYSDNDFLAPPKRLIKEGRYNHTGYQVLYLAEDPDTCFYEMRLPDEGIMIATVIIEKPIKILDLMKDSTIENNIVDVIKSSSLLSSPEEGEGWHKPHYIFTRFIADIAKATGFDAIRYPSVRFNEGYNIVIINFEKLKESIKIIDMYSFNKEDLEINKDTEILSHYLETYLTNSNRKT
ncbi:RES family NAD+ phosphorylase [Paenibacillus taichungensis]|uniref:RES family NAD+ phosphorylase n=1 Tax=Paenibacillus taichungensis TaxID=484184 RepID=UPI0039A4FD97